MPEQHFKWRAMLNDGTVIDEFNPDGTENDYAELPRPKITHFGLRGVNTSYFLDTSTGEFQISDHRGTRPFKVALPNGTPRGLELMFLKDETDLYPYKFFQFKKAHQDSENGGELGAVVIDSHLLGWHIKRARPGSAEVIATVELEINPHTMPVEVWLTATIRPFDQENGPGKVQGTPYKIKL